MHMGRPPPQICGAVSPVLPKSPLMHTHPYYTNLPIELLAYSPTHLETSDRFYDRTHYGVFLSMRSRKLASWSLWPSLPAASTTASAAASGCCASCPTNGCTVVGADIITYNVIGR